MRPLNIIIVSYGGAHFKILNQLYAELTGRGNVANVTFIALTSSRVNAEREGIVFSQLKDFIHLFDEERVRKLGCALVNKEDLTLDYDESVLYHGLGFSDLIQQVGEAEAAEIYRHHGRACFMPVNVMTTIIKSLSANIVIATDSPRYEQAALTASFRTGAESICIPTLFGNREIADELHSSTGLTMYLPQYHTALVSHQLAKGRILEREVNRDPRSIVVTGSPIFDSVASQYSEQYQPFLSRDQLNFDKIYFYATQDYGNSEVILREALVPFITRQNNCLLVVKPHPGEPKDRYENLSKIKGVFVATDWEANDIAFVSDVIIVEDSTVGLESLVMGKCVLAIDLRPGKNNNFRDFNLCPIFDDTAALLFALTNESASEVCDSIGWSYQYQNSVKVICDIIEGEHDS